MRDRTRGLVAVLLASFCLSTLPTAAKIALGNDATALQLLAPRMALGGALLWAWIGLTRPHRIRIDRDGLRAAALAGAVNAVALTLFYLALDRVGAAIATLVFSVYPALLIGLLRLRGEPITRLDLGRLALALAGVGLVSGLRGGTIDPLGIVLALACAVVYAAYMFIVHTRLTRYPASTTALWIVTFFAATIVALRALVGDAAVTPLGTTGWAVVVWSAVVGTVLARIMMIEGIRRLGGGQTALLMPVELVLGVGWAALVLNERLSRTQLVGAGLIVASVALVGMRRRRRPPGTGAGEVVRGTPVRGL